jgi:hypothetical protein
MPEPESPADPEPEPMPEPPTDPEPEPMPAADEPPAEPISEPFWSFSPVKKASKKGKKARVVFPPDPPSDTDVPATDAIPLHRDNRSPPCNEPSSFGRRYATFPVSRYARVADAAEAEVEMEPQPESSTCTSRGRHLANESRWINCPKCRAELNMVAQKMARECSAGWERFA